jgi:hypothetical protein
VELPVAPLLVQHLGVRRAAAFPARLVATAQDRRRRSAEVKLRNGVLIGEERRRTCWDPGLGPGA